MKKFLFGELGLKIGGTAWGSKLERACPWTAREDLKAPGRGPAPVGKKIPSSVNEAGETFNATLVAVIRREHPPP